MPTFLPHRALVLTAGLGTRLRPLTDVRAKPAVPVGGVPLVRRIATWLASEGVSELVLNLHHRPESITAVMGDGRDLGVRVRYSWEMPVVLGSAGGPRQALPLLDAERFLIVNGDTLSNVDLGALVEVHRSSGALVTLALAPNPDPARYGGVILDPRSRVVRIARAGGDTTGAWLFTGVQMVEARVFGGLPAGQPLNSVGGVYDDLLARQPDAIAGHVSPATFWDVGTVADYWRSAMAFAGASGGLAPAERAPTARITRSIFWDDTAVGADAIVDECIVTDRVRIPPGSTYRRAVLREGHDGGIVASTFEVE